MRNDILNAELRNLHWYEDNQAGIDQEIDEWFIRARSRRPLVSDRGIARYRIGPEFFRWEREYGAPLTLWKVLTGLWPVVTDPPPPPPTTGNRIPAGNVVLAGQMFQDNNGIFPAVGATFMYALHLLKTDPERFIREIDWLAERGCMYVRILLMVGTPPFWPFNIEPREFDLLDRVMELCWERNMRIEPVIFADADNSMPDHRDREMYVHECCDFFNQRREKVLFMENANESGLNGVTNDELVRYCEIMADSTDIPFAASSPSGASDVEESLVLLYGRDKCRSPIATAHWDRHHSEDGYRPIRQPWHYQFLPSEELLEKYQLDREDVHMPRVHVNNEPIGVGEKQGGEFSPERIGMGALYSFLCGSAGYCWHTPAGIKGLTTDNSKPLDFKDTPNGNGMWQSIRAVLEAVPDDIANGQLINHHWTDPEHPLQPSINDQIWPDDNGSGLVRAYCSRIGGKDYIGLLGIRNHVNTTPNRNVNAVLTNMRNGDMVWEKKINAGSTQEIVEAADTRSYLLILTDM